MTALGQAIADLVEWSKTSAPWPSSAEGLLDIIGSALTDVPAFSGHEPDGTRVAAFYAATSRLSVRAASPALAARCRASLDLAGRQADYHCAVIAREVGGLGGIAEAWNDPRRRGVRISFAELVAHLATAFAVHGRVPHCGPAGRALLAGAVDHAGPGPFRPGRPPYRPAGHDMAEVQLPFGLPIFVDTADDSVCPDIIRTGWWEPWIHGVVTKCVGQGDVVVNVGANVGYYTLLMANAARSTGRVFAFEPNPRLARLLHRSLTWGGLLGTTTLLPFAASNRRGTATFRFSLTQMGGGALPRLPPGMNEQDQHRTILRERFPELDEEDLSALALGSGPVMQTHQVHTVRLDDTVGRLVPAIHFMLVDAEGAECLVLEGARELIGRSPDLAMVIEWSNVPRYLYTPEQRERAADVVAWLAADGFGFWRIDGDARDVYAHPAILTPLSATEVLSMDAYADLFVCRTG